MKITLLCIQALVSVSLIIAVLLHSAKGEGLGGIGGPAKIFKSSRGMESGLDRITTVLAGLFFLLAGLLNVIF
jgi:preprotein translocase subunit SecG